MTGPSEWAPNPLDAYPTSPIAIDAARVATIAALGAGGGRPLVAAPLEAVLQHLIPKGKLLLARLELRRGERLSWERLRRHLVQWGYRPVERVTEPGDFAHRGGIVDLFPPGETAPVRIELSGDEVDSLHCFDPETQRNTGSIERCTVLPAREVLPFEPLSPEPQIAAARVAPLADLSAGGGRPLVVAPLVAVLQQSAENVPVQQGRVPHSG